MKMEDSWCVWFCVVFRKDNRTRATAVDSCSPLLRVESFEFFFLSSDDRDDSPKKDSPWLAM